MSFDERGEVTEFEIGLPDEACRRGWRALLLAPTLEICRALLAGEEVPISQLRPEAVKRFGLRS